MKNFNLNKISKPFKIKQKMFFDKRGYFQEIYLKKNFNLNIKFTAIAKSKKNVIRGLHFQLKDRQTKLIYVVDGKILDVVINLRKKSKDFGKVSKFILDQGEMLFIPNHYAHGYECVTAKCSVLYHLEKYRNSKYECGIKYNDKKLKIKWNTRRPILSLRDQTHISFDEFKIKYKTL
jgi:dTDP-4-dehydrorhamnose 3,5-epimerase